MPTRLQPVQLTPTGVVLIDQTTLPARLSHQTITTTAGMIEAIQTMVVRGAPAIGIAGAFGVVLAARQALGSPTFVGDVYAAADQLADARPTAVNLMWAINQMTTCLDACVSQDQTPQAIIQQLTTTAQAILAQDIAMNQAMGQYGKVVVPVGARILTHCNAGALATGGYGTALGVIRAAFADDPTISVFADETRPRQQGARLTTWELAQDGIPVTLVSDGMCASLMSSGLVDVVIVGADRIAANGDTANKIGTHTVALVAKAFGVPFYVAAPYSTFDPTLPTGEGIPIEFRPDDEMTTINGERICANGVGVYNPSFDVTPAQLITGIITEKGIARPNYGDSLNQWRRPYGPVSIKQAIA
jgi:methylthioribose-1-phosphate isomerase